MRQLQEIFREQNDMAIIVQLTSAFEDLASMRISEIKNQVLQAQQFFDELWHIYQQLRIDSIFRFGRTQKEIVTNKELYIIISSEAGFSGDIDQRLLRQALKDYDPKKHDIIVVGRHGASLLRQEGVQYKKYYKLPIKDRNINVEPLIREMRQYTNTVAFYQAYVSLTSQDVRRIELAVAVQTEGRRVKETQDIISESNYIFEPNALEVIAHLERSMLQIALAQLIFDSKLAQYASRFQAMSASKRLADESYTELRALFRRSRREIRDERLKETINGIRKATVV